MNDFGTHLPMLLACLARTRGRVLELGCGDCSTRILHDVCNVMGRHLVTADHNEEYLEGFAGMKSAEHEMIHVPNWAKFAAIDQDWDLVLLDHGPGDRRKVDLARLAATGSRLIVVHDTEPGTGYGYEDAMSLFRHRCDHFEFLPMPGASVVSNDDEYEEFIESLKEMFRSPEAKS